ncbi:TIGR00269 family protein [Candidatus Woesearchaeota archaeon]|nr:TIGR00269 family protein [Candidatus Woesearchaeota archaeon]
MPECVYCGQKPVIITERAMCRKHFVRYFEEKVRRTIKRFGLIGRKEKVVVAASGGKDSTTVLYILKKLGYEVEALAINEGIHGYRDATLKDLTEFCAQNKIKLNIVSYKDYFGFTLDELLQKKNLHPCMACGILRRYLLNKASQGYDKLVTGHNLDDEAQSIMMNMTKANVSLMARLGPKTGQIDDARFTPRVKPLYLCSEKEVATYSYLQGFQIKFTECPNAAQSFRAHIRDMLNELEAKTPGTKLGIVHSFLKLMPSLKQMPVAKEMNYCAECGEPSGKSVCGACSIAKAATQVVD